MSNPEFPISAYPIQARILLGRVLLAPLVYFSLATAGALVEAQNPRIPMVALFATSMVAALGLPSARAFMRWQWERSSKGIRWLPVAIFAGSLFYGLTFFARATESSRIVGWDLSAPYVLLSGLAMPLVEEFLFRGVAIGRTFGRIALTAAVLSAICFAALHPGRWVGTFLFSLVAAAFYLKGGLGAAWGFHAAYNLSNYATLLLFSARNA